MSRQPGWQPAPPAPPRRRTGLWVTIAVVVAVVLAGGATALILTSGVERSGDDAGQRPTTRLDRAAAERDAVLGAAEKSATTLNTLDYRDVSDGIDKWESVSTGTLLAEIKRSRDASTTAIEDAKSASEAETLTSAVSDLDSDAGTATVLVAVRATVTAADADPTEKFLRMSLELQRTGDGWKASAIGQVPVGGK